MNNYNTCVNTGWCGLYLQPSAQTNDPLTEPILKRSLIFSNVFLI